MSAYLVVNYDVTIKYMFQHFVSPVFLLTESC